MTGRGRVIRALGVVGLGLVAGVSFVLWRPFVLPECRIVRGMDWAVVAERCGVPDGLVWRPPDYRALSAIYTTDYWDIDVPGCPGPAYRYGSALVVFSFDGGVAAVSDAPPGMSSVVDEEALLGCGGAFVAARLVDARLARAGRAELDRISQAPASRATQEAKLAADRLARSPQ